MADYRHLIKRIQQQDDTAFESLYHQTRYSVYAIIYAITQNPHDIEDLMQETYMRMLKSLNQYDGKANFKTWLLSIAKNLAIDHYRKQKRIQVVDIQEQESIFPSQTPNQYSLYESRKYLSILSIEERTVVLLKTIDRMKHHEIAELLKKPLGTIMWVYNNAIKKMRAYGKEESK
ncbi:MAG: RNA polymerase sigma factor [Acholeplasmataceae bacterium]|nr:RNA polymerase sigma factor [Acholeplasmataceae bacterium]